MSLYHNALLLVRRARCRLIPDNSFSKIDTDISGADLASAKIYEGIKSGKPFMVARYGSTELATVVNYLGVKRKKKNPVSYIFHDGLQWWWSESLINQMQRWSGFFPPTPEKIAQFCQMILDDSHLIDILGCWTYGERKILPYLEGPELVHLRCIEPFWSSVPWTKALNGKKVLVVHPFDTTIKAQYKRKGLLFDNPDILPDFATLDVIKAVQSLGEGDSRFSDWFEALRWMENEIDKRDYDVCLIGCGAYGLPLAAHVKRRGKQAIHLGGALQLLFGIKGKRWEDPMYGVKEWRIPQGSYSSLINEYWVRPDSTDTPKSSIAVEGGCYW